MSGESSNLPSGEWVFYITENSDAPPPSCEPFKFNDPGAFFVPVYVGEGHIRVDASLDLASGINIISKAVVDACGGLEISPFDGTVTLIDHTKVKPVGIVKNFLVGIGDLIFASDFIVLDIEEEESETSMVLGRPFLHEAKTLIDVYEGKITFRLKDKKATIVASPRITCYRISV